MNHDCDIQRAHDDSTTATEPTTSTPITTDPSGKNDHQNNDPKVTSRGVV